jgi:hypothetical protein
MLPQAIKHDTTGTTDIRLAELMAALSLATDLTLPAPAVARWWLG